jgi:putative transposase
MTLKTDPNTTLLPSLFEEVTEFGLEGMTQVLAKLLNQAMKLEQRQALGASDYERTPDRRGYANGYRERTIQTRSGALTVEIPQVRGIQFYPKSLEKGCRSERALKLAIAEMYVNGVSTRKVTEITKELCGLDISSTQVSRFAAMLDTELDAFRNRELGVFKYVYFDARYEKVRHGGKVIDCAVLIAIGVNEEGRREVLGISVELSEAEVHWRTFLSSLKKRGLCGVELFISDAHEGMAKARKAVFPTIPWQRCQFHLAQNAQKYATTKAMRLEIAEAVRGIFDQSTKQLAMERAKQVAEDFHEKNPKFSTWIEENIEEGLQIYKHPKDARKKLRTVNPLELINREVKRRTRVARIFPNSDSLLRLVTAVLVEIHEEWLTASKPYLKT